MQSDCKIRIVCQSKKVRTFSEEIVAEDVKNGNMVDVYLHAFPAEWIFTYRPFKIYLKTQFRFSTAIWRKTNLRFDDTNPVTEDTEYVESIKNDIRWLGFNWANEFYASDYFENFMIMLATIKKVWPMLMILQEEIAAMKVLQLNPEE